MKLSRFEIVGIVRILEKIVQIGSKSITFKYLSKKIRETLKSESEAIKEVKPVKLYYYNKHKRNPFKKPYLKLVWRLDLGNGTKQHELIYGTDVNSITQYQITYLANVAAITLHSGTPQTSSIVLSEEFREEIVDRAVEVALETFQLNKSLKSNN